MTINEIVTASGLSQAAFAREYEIPLRTLQSWILGERKPPVYVIRMLEKLEGRGCKNV